MNRRSFLGLLVGVFAAPRLPTPMYIGLDLAPAEDQAAIFFANAVRPWLTVNEARAREALQLSDDLAFIYEAPSS